MAIKLLLPDKVTLLNENEVLPVTAVAVVQVVPLSADTFTVWPVTKDADKVPLTVWLAVLVVKSALLLPVSSLMTSVDTAGMVELE